MEITGNSVQMDQKEIENLLISFYILNIMWKDKGKQKQKRKLRMIHTKKKK
jgi:hypothetical protein